MSVYHGYMENVWTIPSVFYVLQNKDVDQSKLDKSKLDKSELDIPWRVIFFNFLITVHRMATLLSFHPVKFWTEEN